MLASNPSGAVAADTEARDYQIAVDGKVAGTYAVTVARQDDGNTVVTGRARVEVRKALGLYTYRYSYNGTEVWKGGRLLSLSSSSNDDGKQFTVRATADANGLNVRVNGQESTAPADVWTTSYWHLPDAKQRNSNLTLLDADTAEQFPARLQYVGTSRVRVGGQVQDCAHYRLTGGIQAELYFDGQERLVRKEASEDGHPTVIELIRIRR